MISFFLLMIPTCPSTFVKSMTQSLAARSVSDWFASCRKYGADGAGFPLAWVFGCRIPKSPMQLHIDFFGLIERNLHVNAVPAFEPRFFSLLMSFVVTCASGMLYEQYQEDVGLGLRLLHHYITILWDIMRKWQPVTFFVEQQGPPC